MVACQQVNLGNKSLDKKSNKVDSLVHRKEGRK